MLLPWVVFCWQLLPYLPTEDPPRLPHDWPLPFATRPRLSTRIALLDVFCTSPSSPPSRSLITIRLVVLIHFRFLLFPHHASILYPPSHATNSVFSLSTPCPSLAKHFRPLMTINPARIPVPSISNVCSQAADTRSSLYPFST